jgi:hypothetical protein
LTTSQKTLKPTLSLPFFSHLWLPIIRILSKLLSSLIPAFSQLWHRMLKVESPFLAIMMEEVCVSHNIGIPHGPMWILPHSHVR